MVSNSFSRLAEWWAALQVELHGQSSIRRLEALHKYSQTASLWRVACVCVLTPAPCILWVTLQDVVPLASPREGIYKNYVFWVRDWIGIFLIGIGVLVQFRHCLPRLPIDNRSLLVISAAATCVGVSMHIACSYFIGFPMPFALVISALVWAPAVVAGCYTLWRGFLWQDRSLLDDLMRYVMVFLAQVSTTFVYPAYIFVYGSIDQKWQLVFVVMLPIITIIMKNWIARYLKDVDDLKPEVVIFNIEVFNALYVACSLQSSAAWTTTGMFMVMDSVLAWLSFRDINSLLHQFDAVAGKGRRSDSYSVIDISIHLLRDPQVRNHRRLCLRSAQYDPQSIKPSLSTHAPLSNAAKSSVHPTPAPDTRETDAGMLEIDKLSLDDRVSLVSVTLKLLFLLEFILLIEFTEVIMPIIYAMYMVAMSRLPNRQYYPRLAAYSIDELDDTATQVFAHSMLELLSLIGIALLLNRKLKLSTFHHIAFVLDTLAAEVQTKLILWTVYVVQSMLFHFGVDFSLRFEWLSTQQAA